MSDFTSCLVWQPAFLLKKSCGHRAAGGSRMPRLERSTRQNEPIRMATIPCSRVAR